MKPLILSVYLLLFLIGCRSTKPAAPVVSPLPAVNTSDSCEAFSEYIRQHFKQDSSGLWYFTDPSAYPADGAGNRFYARMRGKCLLGRSKPEIISLFGPPSKEWPERLDYFMKENCREPVTTGSVKGCLRLKFHFDQEGKADVVGDISPEAGPTH